MLVFACISPHPPIILPTVGSFADRKKVKSTISALESLAPKLAAAKPDTLIISSPHPDWGFNVPLHFLLPRGVLSSPPLRWDAIDTSGTTDRPSVIPLLTTLDSPKQHFARGKEIIRQIPKKQHVAWIASGDMSHYLKEDGPYGYHPAGPEFDKKFIELLKKKDISGILNLDPNLVEEAGVCGLWSFCMLFGALEETGVDWQPEILSYEGPFGVGYLVANIRINPNSMIGDNSYGR